MTVRDGHSPPDRSDQRTTSTCIYDTFPEDESSSRAASASRCSVTQQQKNACIQGACAHQDHDAAAHAAQAASIEQIACKAQAHAAKVATPKARMASALCMPSTLCMPSSLAACANCALLDCDYADAFAAQAPQAPQAAHQGAQAGRAWPSDVEVAQLVRAAEALHLSAKTWRNLAACTANEACALLDGDHADVGAFVDGVFVALELREDAIRAHAQAEDCLGACTNLLRLAVEKAARHHPVHRELCDWWDYLLCDEVLEQPADPSKGERFGEARHPGPDSIKTKTMKANLSTGPFAVGHVAAYGGRVREGIVGAVDTRTSGKIYQISQYLKQRDRLRQVLTARNPPDPSNGVRFGEARHPGPHAADMSLLPRECQGLIWTFDKQNKHKAAMLIRNHVLMFLYHRRTPKYWEVRELARELYRTKSRYVCGPRHDLCWYSGDARNTGGFVEPLFRRPCACSMCDAGPRRKAWASVWDMDGAIVQVAPTDFGMRLWPFKSLVESQPAPPLEEPPLSPPPSPPGPSPPPSPKYSRAAAMPLADCSNTPRACSTPQQFTTARKRVRRIVESPSSSEQAPQQPASESESESKQQRSEPEPESERCEPESEPESERCEPAEPDATLTLEPRVCANALNRIVNACGAAGFSISNSSHVDNRYLARVRADATPFGSCVQFSETYAQSENVPGHGRLYCKGLQMMSRPVRNVLLNGLHELDISNAQPTLMSQLLLLNNADSEVLEPILDYVDHRDERLREVMDACQVSRDAAKELVLRLNYGGLVQNWCTENKVSVSTVPDWVLNYEEVVRQAAQLLDDIYGEPIARADKMETSLFRRLSYILQDEEVKCMRALIDKCREMGVQVHVLVHDALVVDPISDEQRAELEKAIEHATGYVLHLKCTQIKGDVEELLQAYPERETGIPPELAANVPPYTKETTDAQCLHIFMEAYGEHMKMDEGGIVHYSFKRQQWQDGYPPWSWWQHLWPTDKPGTCLIVYKRLKNALEDVLDKEQIEWDQLPDGHFAWDDCIEDAVTGETYPHHPRFMLRRKSSLAYVPGWLQTSEGQRLLQLHETHKKQIYSFDSAFGDAYDTWVCVALLEDGNKYKCALNGVGPGDNAKSFRLMMLVKAAPELVVESKCIFDKNLDPTKPNPWAKVACMARILLIDEPEPMDAPFFKACTSPDATLQVRDLYRNNCAEKVRFTPFICSNSPVLFNKPDQATYARLTVVAFWSVFGTPEKLQAALDRDYPPLEPGHELYDEREQERLSVADTHYFPIDTSLDALYKEPAMRRTVICAAMRDYRRFKLSGSNTLPTFSEERLKYAELQDLEIEHGSHPEKAALEQCYIVTNNPVDEVKISDVVHTCKQAADAAVRAKINPTNVGLALSEWCKLHRHVNKIHCKRNGKKVRIITGIVPKSCAGV